MTALLVIGILVFLIVAHELGHFIVAKLFRVRVEEFGIGYPPRAFLLGKIGETEYTINWVLAGGFVRLFGDDADAKRHGKGSYVDAPFYAKAAILLAGVTMNALAGWFLFTGAYLSGIPRVIDSQSSDPNAQLVVADVVPGSPAAAANITAGDRILSVIDKNGEAPKSLAPEDVAQYVAKHNGKPLSVTLVHATATSTVTVIPANAIIPHEASRPALGLALALVSAQPLSTMAAVRVAAVSTWDAFGRVTGSLWTLLMQAIHGRPDVAGVIGPVGLVSVIGDASHNGYGNVLALAAFISINLAVINLIPIPLLDGGRLVLLAFEFVLRREAPRLVVQLFNAAGVILILLLMVTVTYHDILRLLA